MVWFFGQAEIAMRQAGKEGMSDDEVFICNVLTVLRQLITSSTLVLCLLVYNNV